MSAKYTYASLMETPASERDARALELIEEISENADEIQKDVLAEILTQNAHTEYLTAFNLDGATDPETFKSRIPMVGYGDLKPLIRRTADGDQSPILTALPITQFLLSSGTTAGEPKLLPTVEGDWERRAFGFSLLWPVLNKYVKVLDKGKALQFRFMRPEIRTRAGLVAQPVSASFYKGMRLKNQMNYGPNTNRDEAITCGDSFQSMYAQILCGLYERRQIVQVGAAFGSGLVRAIRFLQDNWQQLVHDIRTGSLSPEVTILSVRECMTRTMQPDPELAEFIAEECGRDSWEGIIARIWPNTKYLETIVTGTMAQYIPTLNYYGGGLPIVCTRYATSECFIGINLNPMCNPTQVSYTIMPNMAFFEFLPNEPNSSGPTLVDLVDVEIGKKYELVVTTHAGLYRYQVGDILLVTGFYKSVPQFQFVGRKNFVLSIDTEKTSEADLRVAIENASQLLQELSVAEYTSYADTTTVLGHYVIYWELLQAQDSANLPNGEVLEQCCLLMEESFDSVYRRCRVMDKSIGPLEIRVVKNGTFEEVMNYAISEGASAAQYKVPRCVSSNSVLDLLNSRVMSKHFSPSLPHWSKEQHVGSGMPTKQ